MRKPKTRIEALEVALEKEKGIRKTQEHKAQVKATKKHSLRF